MKKILCFIFIGLFCASLAYAGDMHQVSNIGVPSDSYGSYGFRVYGGGSDCVCTTSDGSHKLNLKCPGFYVFEQYDATATTLLTYYAWFSPVSARWKVSSGSTGDANTGYGIPTDSGFDIEASGANM